MSEIMSEKNRLNELRSLGILDTEAEQDFTEIVELVATLCAAPISYISLIDEERQWFKAKIGLDVNEAEREYAFCNYAIKNPGEIMIVENALEDRRFADNPYVIDDPNVRFYAGVPLVTKNNFAVGTLCIIDNQPRELSKEEYRILELLGKRVTRLIELRKENIIQSKAIENKNKHVKDLMDSLIEAQQMAKLGNWDWDISNKVLYWSPQMYEIFRVDQHVKNLFEVWKSKVHPDDLALVEKTLSEGLSGMHNSIQYRIARVEGFIWVETEGKVLLDKNGNVVRMMGTVQEITERKMMDEQKQYYLTVMEQMLFDLSHKIRRPVTNCMALASLLKDPVSSQDRQLEFSKYLEDSANSLDDYIKETTSFLYQNKIKMTQE